MKEELRRAEAFARELETVFGDSLVAAVLYGSAARGDYRAGISDLNVLVIVRELGMRSLRAAAGIVRSWVGGGNPPPLMLSESEWRSSADVFPIEYSDIREAHVLLAGNDPFGNLHIHEEHLRLRLEHEIRSTKIQLREGYLAAGESPESLGMLLTRSVPTFLTLFRAALRLAGVPVPPDPAEVVEALAARAEFSAAPVLEVIRHRYAVEPFNVPLDGPIAAGYLHAIEQTTRWLDGFSSGDGNGEEI